MLENKKVGLIWILLVGDICIHFSNGRFLSSSRSVADGSNSSPFISLPSSSARWNSRLASPATDTEADLAFRALLCAEIPRDLLPLYRFHLVTRKCYEIGRRGPCGSNMIFVRQAFTRAIGKCTCKYPRDADSTSIQQERHSHSPLIHHPETNNCYFMYTQGYCSLEEWLTFDHETGSPICSQNICIDQETEFTNQVMLVDDVSMPQFVEMNGDCVQLGSQSHHCKIGEIVNFRNGIPACTNVTTLTHNEIN